MELVCALLLLMLGTSAAAPQDLKGKKFTFPQDTDTDHVTLKANGTELGALSVCMRVFSDLLRPHCFFQLTTNSSHVPDNNFLICNSPTRSFYQFYYNRAGPYFNHKNNYIINAWQAVCGTWDAASGLVQLWIDGTHSSRKFLSNSHMMGPMSVILGQGAVVGRGKFEGDNSFVGMLTEVHVWDYVLHPILIRNYGRYSGFPDGNILNWHSADFEIHGRILLE